MQLVVRHVRFQQDDLDANRGSAAYLGLDAGLEELVLAMQKNVMNQVPC